MFLLFLIRLLSAANHPEVDLGMAPPECDMKISSGPPASVHSSAEEKYRISEDIQLDSTTLVSWLALSLS